MLTNNIDLSTLTNEEQRSNWTPIGSDSSHAYYGTFDGCAYLAKKALTRDVGTHSDRADIADIERKALERINALDIGCQGFHGKTTALGVSCEWAYTHIAGLPVAVNIQCHCIRCQKATI